MKFVLFPPPRNVPPPGHFPFPVPASGHPSRAVPGRRVIRETLPGEHAQALFLPRRLPRMRAAAAEVRRKAPAPARRSAAALCSSVNAHTLPHELRAGYIQIAIPEAHPVGKLFRGLQGDGYGVSHAVSFGLRATRPPESKRR